MRRFVWVAVGAAVFVAAGCGGPGAEPSPTTSPASTSSPAELRAVLRADLPVVDGSTSTLPMRMLLLCGLLDIPCDWAGEPSWSPELFVLPVESDSAGAAQLTEHVVNSGTHDAYLSLVSGASDVIIVAREPSDEERAAAEAAGLTLEVRPVAWDAFVFLVNGANPVDDLTREQIRGIYSGQVTDWAQVGGPGLPIQPYQRDPTSGSQELMMRLIMGGTPMIEAPDWLVLWAMTGPFTALATDPSGIGYSVYYYAEYMQPDSDEVAMIAVNGVLPTADTIASGEYPLVAEVHAVIRAGDGGSARALFDWLVTDEGQQAVAATGYVPLPAD
jgi:phosphate transport system substrate-binding protein